MTTRRQLLIAFGASALTAPHANFAQQQSPKIARIGFLGAASASGEARMVEALRAGLRDLGYVEGKNIVIEFRWAEGEYERLPGLAAELVRLKVDVLVTHGVPGSRAAKDATGTISIVMMNAGNAVAYGLVASLARPGGNVTGSTQLSEEFFAKGFELLKEAFPRTRQIAFLINPGNPGQASTFPKMVTVARSLKIDLQKFEARDPKELESAFSAMAVQRIDAVSMTNDPLFRTNFATIADLAARQRLPSVGNPEFADAGGLIGQGVSFPGLHRRAAYFVDRILKGAKPADLPVEQPTKFELVLNLKTAKALGLTIPQSVLVRADRVIE